MDGILVINKPQGITSHDVVDFIRKRFNIKKVGHAGTLDPMATGVLVVLIGNATKHSNFFTQDDKEYVARLLFGKKTDTQDSSGKVIEERDVDPILAPLLKRTFDSFLGPIDQTPPMVSAIKFKGKKLYELARRNKVIPRKPRRIEIKEIELLEYLFPEAVFRIKCSKGTYVRTLCEDIGHRLNVPSHLSGLIRTRSGRFSLKEAVSLEEANEKDIQPLS